MNAKLIVCPLAAALAGVLVAGPAAAVPIVLNPSLTGPQAVSSAPPDWFNWQDTPDTADALGPFNFTGVPWTLSPDGGTFVRGGSSASAAEAIAQNVSTFTPGQTYEVSFFQTNLGFSDPVSGAWTGQDGFWELIINGVPADTSTVIAKQATATTPIVWSGDSMTFVAPTPTVEVALRSQTTTPVSNDAAYLGIDGVEIRAVGVPEPGAAWLLGLALGAVASRRR